MSEHLYPPGSNSPQRVLNGVMTAAVSELEAMRDKLDAVMAERDRYREALEMIRDGHWKWTEPPTCFWCGSSFRGSHDLACWSTVAGDALGAP